MLNKTKKAQVVLAALDSKSQTFCFLLLQTNQKRGQFWQNVTGKIDEGESYEEGGLREAIEETGLSIETIVDIIDLGITHEFTDERKRKVKEKSFLIILEKQWTIKIDPHEHQDFKWIGIDEIKPEVVKHIGNFEALDKARNKLLHWSM